MLPARTQADCLRVHEVHLICSNVDRCQSSAHFHCNSHNAFSPDSAHRT